MPMDSTLQVRMDSQTKASVEELYRSLGTSFAEAVRIFARQSLLAGGMPFRPALKAWEELDETEIDCRLSAGEADIQAGRVCSQEALDARMREKLRYEQ